MMQLPDLVWGITSFILTLMVFSYILGDNPLFRLASYILVGATAGYLFSLVVYQIVIQRLVLPFLNALTLGSLSMSLLLAICPILLSLMLLFKLSSGKAAVIGNLPMAYLVGVGAAVLITGAVTGTILGQAQATINLFGFENNGLIEAIIILVGTITTVIYFHFGTRPNPTTQGAKRLAVIESLAWVGKIFISVTLGALFAGVYLAALSALVERLDFIRHFIVDVLLKTWL